MSTLLGTEGLIFAALAVSLTLTARSETGTKQAVRPTTLAVSAVGVLSVVALGAAATWFDALAGQDWPDACGGRVGAVTLLFAILAQPVIAGMLARNVLANDKPPK